LYYLHTVIYWIVQLTSSTYTSTNTLYINSYTDTMGNSNARMQGSNLANYGAGYDSYYNYGGIENYGSAYQPAGGGYPIGYGITDGPLFTSVKPPLGGLGALGQGGIGAYGTSYLTGFNPMLQTGLIGPKIRVIYVPNNVLSGFQNLLQPGGVSGVNPVIGGIGGVNPLIGGIGGANPYMGGINCVNPAIGGIGGANPLIGGIGGANPLIGGIGGANPLIGGIGGYGFPQVMPQMPIPQFPLPQMGSNCCSISLQLPSVSPGIPYPIPCPPPMIQPIIPQMPMRKITLHMVFKLTSALC
jgi:hypothetical protein